MAGRRLRSKSRRGPERQDAATQTDSPSCCSAVLNQLQAVQRELSEARRQLRGAPGGSLDPSSPQAPAPERDPLELPSCSLLTGSSKIRVLGESHYPERIQWTPDPAYLGPSPLLVKSEPADEEPPLQLPRPPSGPRPHPLWLQDSADCILPCKEELRDNLQPSDNAHLDPASLQALTPERDLLELPSCTPLTGSSKLSVLGEGSCQWSCISGTTRLIQSAARTREE